MFESLCSLPLTSDLFTQALHPSEPILAVGLAAGHVQCFRLPSSRNEDEDEPENGQSILSVDTSATATSIIETEWRTRRHKGSCRYVGFSSDGQVLYSAGTDSLLKAASAETGRVTSKIAIPLSPASQEPDHPSLLHALSPQTLLLATDSCALHLYDLRTPTSVSSKPSQTYHPHDDYISSLTPLGPTETSTSGFSKQWITTGGTTLAVTDLRRGVLVKSEDQEEELLSSIFVDGLPHRPNRSKGEKVLVGSGDGVLTLWERGVWDDQSERIIVDKDGESLDVLAQVPDHIGTGGKSVVVGLGDGTVRMVQLGVNKVINTFRHDDLEGVVGLGFDVEGRMISGGGTIVKIWSEIEDLDEEDDDSDSDDSEGSDSDEEEEAISKKKRKTNDTDGMDLDATSIPKVGGKRRKGKAPQGSGILNFNLN